MSFFSAIPRLEDQRGPLYIQLERLLRDAILNGSLPDNEPLPPERNLAESCGVSRLTVRKALTDLQQEGLVVRRRGSGTFVSNRAGLSYKGMPLFREDLIPSGQDMRSTWLSRTVDKVSADETMILGIAPGTQIYRLQRLRCNSNGPVMVEHSVVLRHCLPSELLAEESLYRAMAHHGYGPSRALQRLRAVALEAEYAALLDVPAGTPGLFTERRGFLSDGRTVELTKTWHRSDFADLIGEVSVHNVESAGTKWTHT